MNPMQCERARELLSPYVDGELSAEERRAVAAHIQGCRTCEAQVADFHRVGRTLAETGRESMPKALALRLRANLAREAEKAAPALVEPVAVMAASRRRPFAT